MTATLAALLALTVQMNGKPVPASAGSLISGTYVERAADGSADCGNAEANRLVLRVLDEPPHYRSNNIGEIDYRLGGTGGGYYLTGQPILGQPDAAGGRSVSLSGGIVHAVSRFIAGIPDSSLRGRFRGELRLGANDDMSVLELSFDDRWRAGDAATIDVADGRLSDGTVLRPFGRCDAGP